MKRLLLFAALIVVAGITSAQVYIRPGQLSQSWDCGLNGIADSLTECQAAPASATQSYYITDIKVQTTTTTSGTYAIQSGTGSNCGSNTTTLFPSTGNASHRFNAPVTTSAMANITFNTPIAVPAGHAVCLIGVATNTISVYIGGFVQ